jgi:hypothetical protein
VKLAAVLALGVALAACGADATDPAVLLRAEQPAALAPEPGGGLLVGERLTGDIRRVDPGGSVSMIASVDVATDGEQRGLLGLAAGADGRVFASYTRDLDGRIVIAEVLPTPREVWLGPPSATLANGGRLAWLGDRLVIGIGSLGDETAIDDPDQPNGKLISVDPDGLAEQPGSVLAGGFHNPFAFAVFPSGAIVVADNEPGDDPERLLRWRVGQETKLIAEIEPHTVTSGIAIEPDGSLLLCSYLRETLQRWTVTDLGAAPVGDPLADDCRLGVAVLADGQIVYATDDQVRLATQP